jgi:hypothetical protein
VDNLSAEETEQPEEEEEEEYELLYNPTFKEVWKTINNVKIYFKNKENEIRLSMVTNLQIQFKERKCLYNKR